MATHVERSEKTTRQIVEVAWQIFARDGYAKAALAEIVNQAGVTTGAIYHHFGGKKGLFIAVAERVEQYIVDELISNAPSTGSPYERFELGILETLQICSRPKIQRIVFRDAPTVIGVFEWRKIEIKYGFGVMKKSLTALADEGVIYSPNPEMTAHILLGAIMEAADAVAMSEDPELSLVQAKETIQIMLAALKSA